MTNYTVTLTNVIHSTSATNGIGNSKSNLLTVINIFIGSVGLVGNTFVIIIIACFTSMHKHLANLFVINQSFIDAISSLLVMITHLVVLLRVQPVLIPNTFASEFYCRIWKSRVLLWGTYTSSIYNLVMLTVERYLKIVHPIFYKTWFILQKAKLLLLSVWLFGIIFELAYGIPTSQVDHSLCLSVSIWPNYVTQQTVGYLIIIVQYWLPLVIFIFSYTRMIRIFGRTKIHNGTGKRIKPTVPAAE